MFTVIYQSIDTKLTRSQAKRRRLNPINPIGITDDTPRIESTQDKDNKKLLWCHPEMAKGFIGCSVRKSTVYFLVTWTSKTITWG